jgi:hypothetical protein
MHQRKGNKNKTKKQKKKLRTENNRKREREIKKEMHFQRPNDSSRFLKQNLFAILLSNRNNHL